MKQRYLISHDEKTSELTIEEYAVIAGNLKRHEISALAKDDFTLLCIESYEDKIIKMAISQGKEISIYAGVIADSVIEIYGKNNSTSKELLFDDLHLLESYQNESKQG
jgi:hypothetical protein